MSESDDTMEFSGFDMGSCNIYNIIDCAINGESVSIICI